MRVQAAWRGFTARAELTDQHLAATRIQVTSQMLLYESRTQINHSHRSPCHGQLAPQKVILDFLGLVPSHIIQAQSSHPNLSDTGTGYDLAKAQRFVRRNRRAACCGHCGLRRGCAALAGVVEGVQAEHGLSAAAQRSGARAVTAAHAGRTGALPARCARCGADTAPHARAPGQAADDCLACGCHLHSGRAFALPNDHHPTRDKGLVVSS